jgi:hypothetical protein
LSNEQDILLEGSMALSDKQLKFLEEFVLRRELGRPGTQSDSSAEQERAEQRHNLLQKLAGLGALTEGRPEEQQTLAGLVQQVRTLLGDEIPAQGALDQAVDALKQLTDHVEDVQKDIALVRKPRFEKGQAALAALRNVSLKFPQQCPEDDKQALMKEHGELTALLAPMKGWANINAWDEEDLISIDVRTDRLAFDCKKLREEVEQAVQALDDARAAATKAMKPTGATGFSDAQSAQMLDMLRAASQQAEQNVLRADESIRALQKLARHATETEQLRERISNQIAALPDTPPAGASAGQKGEWTRLRDDALAAVDEVLAP